MSYLIRWGYWYKASERAVADNDYVYAKHPGYLGLSGAWKWVFSFPKDMTTRARCTDQFETRQAAEDVLIGGLLANACPQVSQVTRSEDIEAEIGEAARVAKQGGT